MGDIDQRRNDSGLALLSSASIVVKLTEIQRRGCVSVEVISRAGYVQLRKLGTLTFFVN